MLVFSNSKINLGLWILNKRKDDYHTISTVFYPIDWCDVIEIIPDFSKHNSIHIRVFGIELNIPANNNIIYKAYQLLLNKFTQLPYLNVYLYKNVPFGAGLGAGSANATCFIKACNQLLQLNLSAAEIKKLVASLGADCAFFVENIPALASGKGDILNPIPLNLNEFYLLIIFPNLHISTQEAYRQVKPQLRTMNLKEILQLPITEWRYHLENDFEKSIFKEYPILNELKQSFYKQNALYASISGSGSAIYGIFKEKPHTTDYQAFKYHLKAPKI